MPASPRTPQDLAFLLFSSSAFCHFCCLLQFGVDLMFYFFLWHCVNAIWRGRQQSESCSRWAVLSCCEIAGWEGCMHWGSQRVTLTPRWETALSQALPLSPLLLAGYLEPAPCNLRCIVINHLLFSVVYWILSALPLLITQFAYIHKNIWLW